MMFFKSCTPSKMTRQEFVEHFADIYEHSPWVAEGAFDIGLAQSHNQIAELHQLMVSVLNQASDAAKLRLINAHPDLAGKAAIAGELTTASTAEQAGAGINNCTQAEFTHFSELNDRYKNKFNFPFIKAVKGSNKHSILQAFETRINNDEATEFSQAIVEINKIAHFRLTEL